MFRTKKWLIGVFLIAILVMVFIFGRSFIATDSSPGATVFIDRNGFEPRELVIRRGQSIEFVNREASSCPVSEVSCNVWPASDVHPTHDVYKEFDPRGPIAPGKSWIFVFDRVGNWGFHDHLKPQLRGVIRVIE